MRLALAARRSVAVAAATALLTTGGVAGGLLSSPALAAAAAVSSATPAAVDNSGNAAVTINGAGFDPANDTVDFVPTFGAAVSLASMKATVDTINSTANALKVTVASSNAAPGDYDIRVEQAGLPLPATTTCAGCFTVVSNSGANVSSSAPGASTGNTGRGAGALDISGTFLAKGAFVKFLLPNGSNDAGLAFTPGDPNDNNDDPGYASSSLIRGNYDNSTGAPFTPGRHILRVTNTDGGTGATADFYQPSFTAGGVSPSSLGQGAQNRTVTVTGQGFRSGSSLIIQDLDSSNASDVTVGAATVSPDGTTISAPVSFRSNATVNTFRTVTVYGPDGGYLSVPNAFKANAGPTLTSLNIDALGQGASTDVQINGTGFTTGGTNAATRPLFTFSGTGVTAVTKSNTATAAVVTITVASNAPTGGRTVTVTNPDGGAATLGQNIVTMAYPFTVNAGPTITSVSPASSPTGTTKTIVVKGTNFDDTNGMQFLFSVPPSSAADSTLAVGSVTVVKGSNGADDTATFPLTIAGGAPAGLRDVHATNKGDFGSAVCAGCFGIDSLTVSPSGGSNNGIKVLTITASNLAANSTVELVRAGDPAYQPHISGSGVTVAAGGGSMTASFDLTGAAPGPYAVVVDSNGTPLSCASCFTVTGSTPALTSVTPATGGQGATNRAVTLTGTSFSRGETVTASGSGVTFHDVTYVSPTQLTALVDITAAAATGARDVTVKNADGIGTVTKTGAFTVTSSPTVSSVSPASRGQGAKSEQITISGDGFDSALTKDDVSFGPGITVTAVTVTQGNGLPLPPPAGTVDTIVATVTIAENAAANARNVSVSNPDGGTGTKTGAFTVNPGPKVLSIAPQALAPGATNQSVTISGNGFASNAVPTIDNVTLTNVVVAGDGLSITATAAVAADAVKGPRNVVVSHPTDKGVGTCTACFYVAVPPGAPTGVTTTAAQNSVVVSWVAPTDDGGAPVTSYVVSAKTINANGTPGTDAGSTATVDGATRTAAVTGLTPGTTYRLYVVARNAAGSSAPGTATGTPKGVPSAPVVKATPGDTRVTVSWSGASPNGSTITGYKVAIGNSTPVSVSASTASYTFTGLTNGTSYTFKVQATNGYGDSTAGTASATPRFATRLYISRTPGVSTSGQAVTFYGKLTRAGTGAPIVGARVTVALTPDVGKGEQAFPVTDINGVYKYTTKPVYNLTFRAGFSGDADDAGVITLAYRQAVMTKVTVTSPASGGYTSASSPLKVTGTTSPNKAGSTVYLSRYSGGRWITVGKGTVATNGSFVVYGTLPVGDYQLRAGVAAAKGNAAGNSATFVSHRR